MKAMILCAGKGTRVRPVTYCVNKPMIPLINRPILSYILDHLKEHGFTEVVCNTSYRADDIEGYFRDGADHGIAMSYSFEGYIEDGEVFGIAVGSAGGMKRVQERSGFFDDTFVVLCGDAIVDLDLAALVAFHKEKGALATLATLTVPDDEVSKYGIVVADEDGRVQAFQEKPDSSEAKSNLANTGIYVFEPEIFDYIPGGTEYDIGGELLPDLIQRGLPFYASAQPFEWIDVGAVDDYFDTSFGILEGKYGCIDPPGEKISEGVWAGSNVAADGALSFIEGPVHLGSGCTIKPGAIIKGPAVIGANAVVEAGASIDRSIVAPYAHVLPGCHLRDHALIGDWIIKRGAESSVLADSEHATFVRDVREQEAPEAQTGLVASSA